MAYRVEISHLNWKREKKWLRWQKIEYTKVEETTCWGDPSPDAQQRWNDASYELTSQITPTAIFRNQITDDEIDKWSQAMEQLDAARVDHVYLDFTDRSAALMYKLSRC